MATVKGTNQTAIDTGGLAQKLDNGLKDARIKVAHDTYTAVGDEAAATVIKMGGALPAGAKIVGIGLACNDIGSGVTLSVGDSNSATRYYNAVDGHNTRGFNTILVGGMGYEIGTVSGDEQILITTASATLATGKIIKLTIRYSID